MTPHSAPSDDYTQAEIVRTLSRIEKKVDSLLDELGLTECANVLIGGPLIKGISGGQRKRTSVGVELITDPSVRSSPLNDHLVCDD